MSTGLRRGVWLQAVVLAVLVIEGLVLATVPRFLGWSTFVVYGGSMQPAIKAGSVAVARPVKAEQLKVGDVIAYHTPGSSGLPTLHRVIELRDGPGGRSLVIKGDANAEPDPFQVTLQGSGSKVVYSVPEAGRLIDFGRRPLGRVLLFQFPLCALGLFALFEIWVPERKRASLRWL